MIALDDLRHLAAWRLAHQMTVRVDIFLHCPDFRRHYTLCERLAEAARAGPRYIADGHASRNHAGFAQLVRKAAASEAEVLDYLIDAGVYHPYSKTLLAFTFLSLVCIPLFYMAGRRFQGDRARLHASLAAA